MLGRAIKKGRCRTLNYYSLLNTPVIQYPSGRKIGTVSDIFLKENSTEIFGIVATNKSLIYQNRLYVPNDIIYTGTHEVSVFKGKIFKLSPYYRLKNSLLSKLKKYRHC